MKTHLLDPETRASLCYERRCSAREEAKPDSSDEQHMLSGGRINGVIAHEFLHSIGLNHAPNTGNPPTTYYGPCYAPAANEYVNMGHYEAMVGIGANDLNSYNQLTPTHEVNTSFLGWLTRVDITSDVEGLHVPDVHGQNPKFFVVRVPPANRITGAPQAFAIAGHQQTSFDACHPGRGLLIWHLLAPGSETDGVWNSFAAVAWDLEGAGGRYTTWDPVTWIPSGPDPVAGKDHMEADHCWGGDVDDFYNDGQPGDPPGVHQHTAFSPDTNPNSNLYALADYQTPQSVATSISIENIHKDPVSTDMIVDVYVTPKQKVTFPNGGQEYVASGEPWNILWAVRPHACVTNVGISLSSDNGFTYTPLASSLGNSGSYTTTGPQTAGTGYLVKVTSNNATPTVGEDVSDASFTVWSIPAASILYSNLVVNENGTFSVAVNWQTTVTANDLDQLILTPPPGGSSVGTYVNSINGLNHSMTFTGTCTPGNWTYVVKSRRPRYASGDPKSIATGTSKTFRIDNCLEL